MTRASAGAWLVLLALLALSTLALVACARTRDLYVGSDVDPDESQLDASGGLAPMSAQDGGTTEGASASAGRPAGAGASGSAGSTGAGGAGGSLPTRPPPVLGDAGGPLDCATGTADCDGRADNGCETELGTDAEHCGRCGNSCTGGAGVASATCAAGTCELTCSFPSLLGDCDGDASNGCETDLFHDPNNCSECGMRCNACADARCL